MPTTLADVNSLRQQNTAVVALAKRALDQFWASLDLERPESARDALLAFMPELVATYGQAAASVAASWYETVRADDVPGRFTAQLADVAPVEQVQKNVRYFAGHLFDGTPDVMLAALGGVAQRHVVNTGRATMQLNAYRDKARPRYARVPTGFKTCAFCSLLASRGFVYATFESAKFASDGDKYHDDCDCQPVVDFSDEPAIDGYEPDRLYDLYRSARSASGATDIKSIAAEMRRQNPDLFTDGVVTSN